MLGSVPGKKAVVFLDEFNMPQQGIGNFSGFSELFPYFYGIQGSMELIRQMLDSGGFYDRKKLFFKEVADTQLLVACGPPLSAGRSLVSPRVLRYFQFSPNFR